jgi:hypothetical protein
MPFARPANDHLFGIVVGFVAVTVLQVKAFDEELPLALLYSALIALGALAAASYRAASQAEPRR